MDAERTSDPQNGVGGGDVDHPPLPEAVVFDFDGLMFDSEVAIFRMYTAALEQMGHGPLTEAQFAACIGLGHDDSWRALCGALGADLDRDEFELHYGRQDRAWVDSLPVFPGLLALLDDLADHGVPCGVASSSSNGWVEGHLDRVGIRHRFGAVAGRDRVGGRSKPAPDCYLAACEDLGAAPARSVALEDSGPGITAARAAGLTVVAVPNAITVHTDLSAAHHAVASLTELTTADLARLAAPHR